MGVGAVRNTAHDKVLVVASRDQTQDLRTLEELRLEKFSPFEPAGYHRRSK
jgi:hypothetical protein